MAAHPPLSVREKTAYGLGDVAVTAGDLATARAQFQRSLDIFERLAADPTSAEAQRDVIVGCAKLAQMTGDRAYWQRALPVVEGLAARGQLAPVDAWMLEDIRHEAAAD